MTFVKIRVYGVINSSRIHNPIAIIQIIFHIFRHSVSMLNMTYLEFGPKFVMLATHPLEYLTTIGFVWQLFVAVFSLPLFLWLCISLKFLWQIISPSN